MRIGGRDAAAVFLAAVLLLAAALGAGWLLDRPDTDGLQRATAETSGEYALDRLVRCKDGDTIVVISDSRERVIRLWGIDTPELGQAFGQEAKQALIKLLGSQAISLECRDRDRKYDREVCVVRVGGRDVGAELLRLGLAHWYVKYAPESEEYRRAEQVARDGKLGLWQQAAPVPPWALRRQKRQP